jgi:hypothetical protein
MEGVLHRHPLASNKGSEYYPPYLPREPAGRVKLETLEFFAYSAGWHRPAELRQDILAPKGDLLVQGTRRVEVRLLRYTRMGLLERRRASESHAGTRGYEYRLTLKGEKRLLYIWKDMGFLNQDKAKSLEDLKIIQIRLDLKDLILKKHLEKLFTKRNTAGNS